MGNLITAIVAIEPHEHTKIKNNIRYIGKEFIPFCYILDCGIIKQISRDKYNRFKDAMNKIHSESNDFNLRKFVEFYDCGSNMNLFCAICDYDETKSVKQYYIGPDDALYLETNEKLTNISKQYRRATIKDIFTKWFNPKIIQTPNI